VFSDNNFQSAEEVKGVLTKYRKYTARATQELRGGQPQAAPIWCKLERAGNDAYDGRRVGLKLNLTHVIDGFHGNEHTLPITR